MQPRGSRISARRWGLTKGGFFHHFKGKEDVATAKAFPSPEASRSPESLALLTEAVRPGAFVLAGAKMDPGIAAR